MADRFAHLPSLNALRAFEAAARRLSFKAAAEELYVTPGAVSQQVKLLEEELQVRLFVRTNRGIRLTESAQRLFPAVTEAFGRIDEATAGVKEHRERGPLTVSVLPSFAARWLVPRLGRFRQAHPEIDLRIDATPRLVDLAQEDVDVAIRHGTGHYPGLFVERLMADSVFPVCTPALMAGPPVLRQPEDLRHHTLLHDETPNHWLAWLQAHGVSGVDGRRGAVFSDAGMVVQAALDGQGVALSRGELVRDELAAGRLMRPFDLRLPYELAYYLVCLPDVAEVPKVRDFREWIHAEAARAGALLD